MKSYTDLEQSKKLAEFLPLKSADMWYWEFPTAPTYNGYGYPMFHKGEDIRNVPCWSLAALLSLLPKGTNISTPKPVNELSYCCWNQYNEIYADNPVDAAFKMLVWLKENNLKEK